MTKLIFRTTDSNEKLEIIAYSWCASNSGIYYRESRYSELTRVDDKYYLIDVIHEGEF